MSRTTEALRKAAQIQAANNGGAQGSSSCRSFSSVAGAAPIPPYARIGDRFIIRLPDYIQVADDRSRVRPAILWETYRDKEGNIIAASFLATSTKRNKSENYAGNFQLPPALRAGKALAYVITNSFYMLSNRFPAQGGNILKREVSGGSMFQPYLPDLIVRRVFSLCTNGYPNFFPEPGLGISGTMREGVYFPTLKRCNLRSDIPQPDVPDCGHSFIHREIVLPGGLTQDDVNRIAAWSSWWSRKGRFREQGLPEPGTFRTTGWPGWDDFKKIWRGTFKDWSLVLESERFPHGRPAPHQGNCNSVSQPSGPAPLRL